MWHAAICCKKNAKNNTTESGRNVFCLSGKFGECFIYKRILACFLVTQDVWRLKDILNDSNKFDVQVKNVKVNFTLKPAMKTQWGSGDVALLFL